MWIEIFIVISFVIHLYSFLKLRSLTVFRNNVTESFQKNEKWKENFSKTLYKRYDKKLDIVDKKLKHEESKSKDLEKKIAEIPKAQNKREDLLKNLQTFYNTTFKKTVILEAELKKVQGNVNSINNKLNKKLKNINSDGT